MPALQSKTVSELEIGESGFILPHYLNVDDDLNMFVTKDAPIYEAAEEALQSEDQMIHIFRLPEGFHVRLASYYRYSIGQFNKEHTIPVCSVDGQEGPLIPPESLKINQEEKKDNQQEQKEIEPLIKIDEPDEQDDKPVLLLKEKGEEKKEEDEVKGKKIIDLDNNEHGYMKPSDAYVDESLNMFVDCEVVASELPTETHRMFVQKTALGYAVALDANHKYKACDTSKTGHALLQVAEFIGTQEITLPVEFLDVDFGTPNQEITIEDFVADVEEEIDPALLYYYRDLKEAEDDLDEDDLAFEETFDKFERKKGDSKDVPVLSLE